MLFALPISGYIDSCAGGYHLTFFDYFDIPKLISINQELEKLMVIIHQISAYTLIGLLLMHIGAAFKHHFIQKDNILLRMLPTNLRK
jgi:cytochrome b561